VKSGNVTAERHLVAMEDLLMAAFRAGGDRQALHERIRVHAMAAAERLLEQYRVIKWVGL
jgi:adenylosuccinate lyase